jgi:hypothetical protein
VETEKKNEELRLDFMFCWWQIMFYCTHKSDCCQQQH